MTQKHKVMLQKLEHLVIASAKAGEQYKRGDRQMAIAHLRRTITEAEHLIATLETLHFNNLAEEAEEQNLMENSHA